MSTTVWPASCHSRSRSSTTAKPRWTSGEVGSMPSFTRSGRPCFNLPSSPPSGRTCTAWRVGTKVSTRASLVIRSGSEPPIASGRTTSVTRELAHLSDEALVALAARSEQTALGELYDRYARPAYGLALRVLRDEALAEDAVQQAFQQLPDQQREALELAYYGGFTQSELAEKLGQPIGTIKSRMFAGLARLRELLGDPGMETAWTSTT